MILCLLTQRYKNGSDALVVGVVSDGIERRIHTVNNCGWSTLIALMIALLPCLRELAKPLLINDKHDSFSVGSIPTRLCCSSRCFTALSMRARRWVWDVLV